MKNGSNRFKKSLLIVAISALIMSLLAACGQSSNSGGSGQGGTGSPEQGENNEKIELRFAGGGHRAGMIELCKRLQSLRRSIRI